MPWASARAAPPDDSTSWNEAIRGFSARGQAPKKASTNRAANTQVGDAADRIPGLPRWGAKTTSTVLARFGHIEAIPDDGDAWDVKVRGASSLATVLADNRELAGLYRTLAALRTDVPLEEDLGDLEWRGADRAAMSRLTHEVFGSPGIMDMVPTWR